MISDLEIGRKALHLVRLAIDAIETVPKSEPRIRIAISLRRKKRAETKTRVATRRKKIVNEKRRKKTSETGKIDLRALPAKENHPTKR